MKVYVLKAQYDHIILDEIEYSNENERYDKTKDIPKNHIFEEEELDKAIDMVYELNRT